MSRRSAGTLATTATIAAGFVAARRRMAVRPDGSEPPDPSSLGRLAAWRPPPPTGRLSRALAYGWASPVTLAGLLAGAAGGRATVRRRAGVLVLTDVGGLTGAALRLRGFSAVTLGHIVLCRAEPSPALLAHELVHVRQAERFGVLMAPLYLGLMAVYGYHRHPMERAARLAQREVAGR